MSFISMDLRNPKSVVMPNCFKGLKVLLVDYDTTSLMYMASALEEESYKVTTTELASIALSMIGERENQYDIVIADIDMPEMDGFHFLKKILTMSVIPIIMMSSSEDLDLAKRALDEGASFFFLKPIRIHNLVNVWQHVFRERLERESEKVLLEKKGFLKVKSLDGKDGKAKGVVHMQTISNTNGLDLNFGKLVSSVLEINIEQNEAKGHINEIHHARGLVKNGIDKCNYMVHVDVTDHGMENLLATNSIGEHEESHKRKRVDDARDNKDIKRTTNYLGLVKHNPSSGKKLVEEKERKQMDKNGISSEKKSSRLIWTPQLRLKFKEAVAALGEDRAQPAAILKLMRAPHLTTRHIGSYLQKYREKIKRDRLSQSNSSDECENWKPIEMYDSISQCPQMSKAFNPTYEPSITKYTPPSLHVPKYTPSSLHVRQPHLNIGSSSYYKLDTLERLFQENNLSSKVTRKTNVPDHNLGGKVQRYSEIQVEPPMTASSGIHSKTIEEAEKILGLEEYSTCASQFNHANEASSSMANDHQQPYLCSKPMVSQEMQNLNDFSSNWNGSGMEAHFDVGQISSSEDIYNLLEGFYDASLDMVDAITAPNAPPCTLSQQQPSMNDNTCRPFGGDEVCERSSGYTKGDEIDSFVEWLEFPPNS